MQLVYSMVMQWGVIVYLYNIALYSLSLNTDLYVAQLGL